MFVADFHTSYGYLTSAERVMASSDSYSFNSEDSKSSPMTDVTSNIVHYGPIQVRLCRKLAPTLATGRRSKHMTLTGDEALKREKRREKNRLAARKLKEKRQVIEDELSKKVQELEGEHSELRTVLKQLQQHKEYLEQQIDRFLVNPTEDVLRRDHEALSSLFDEYLAGFDHWDISVDLHADVDVYIGEEPFSGM